MTFKKLIKNRLALAGLIGLALILLLAIFGPFLIPYSPTGQQFAQLKPPSLKHFMGTDDLGRDITSRVLYGSRLSLSIGFSAIAIALIIGLIAGSISGYAGGLTDTFIMRLVDIFLAFPYVLGAIALMVVMGSGFLNVVIAIAAFMWASFARLHRANVLGIKEAEFIQAAKLSGASNFYIITRHILPNTMGPLVVYASISVGIAILGEAVLSFISIGLQPPTPSLGLMLSGALQYVETAPWLMLFPGLFLFLIVLCFVLIGEGLRDALDPKEYA